VEFPRAQTCCGQMHYNTGYQAEALPLPLLERFVMQFHGAEAVAVPSSSCVAMMRDHYPKMPLAIGRPELIVEVDALLPKVFELRRPLVHKDGGGEGWIGWLPGLLGGWTQVRDLQEMLKETFRDWWERRKGNGN
jgi:hypothetical protein